MKIIPFEDFIRRYYSGEEFIVFDTETTGLNTFHDNIIEVGARVWSKNGKGAAFDELLWVHENRILPEAQAIHKIPTKEILAARQPEAVLKDFMNFCEGRVLVAHNIKFDFPMLNSNLIRANMTPYQIDDVVCSLVYAKQLQLPGKLSALAKHFKVKADAGALHRALYDVDVLIEVLDAFMTNNEPQEMQYSLIM